MDHIRPHPPTHTSRTCIQLWMNTQSRSQVGWRPLKMILGMYFRTDMVKFCRGSSPTKRKRKAKARSITLLSSLLNRLKGGEMAWCRPMRTGAGRCRRVRWRACRGRARGPSSSRRTRRDSASLCATSSCTHRSRPSPASR